MPSNDNMDILRTMLLTWTDEEVSKAWKLVAEEGKNRKNRRMRDLKTTLLPGEKVSFTSRGGNVVVGTVYRVKYKKALVDVPGVGRYDCHLSILKRV